MNLTLFGLKTTTIVPVASGCGRIVTAAFYTVPFMGKQW
jgi:hypothetical protein